MSCDCAVPSAPGIKARIVWMNQIASILTTINRTVSSHKNYITIITFIEYYYLVNVYRSNFTSVRELMAQPLTTQSPTLTPPLERHVTLLQFQLQHVPVDSAATCLIPLSQYVLTLLA